jgi:diaminopropionate ammonia-lyase
MDLLHVTRPVTIEGLDDIPLPSIAAEAPLALLRRCPMAEETPLIDAPVIAAEARVAGVWLKDERGRMGLGSFKALGAAYVIAHDAQKGSVEGRTYVTASAGNHGLSVAAGAAAFGARAVIYIAETVPDGFASKLKEIGAEVERKGATYEESMQAAEEAAKSQGWTLLSDSSWPGYTDAPYRVMEGYLALMDEAIQQMPEPPTHLFLQAGVGGLAGACAALARERWGEALRIIVVEPEVAPALFGSIKAGKPLLSNGPVSQMGRLDCKMPSLIALKGLARDADAYVLINEAEGEAGAGTAMVAGWPSTPSGAAGLSGLLALDEAQRAELSLDETARVLCILSEGPES